MPGRKYDAGSSYRYGFNGKENDNEVKGEGNQQDYGTRISDTRLGRFLSVDAATHKYSSLSSYQYSANRPIDGIDLDGLEYLSFHSSIYKLVYGGTSENNILQVPNSYIGLAKIYENIPTQLQNSQTCGLTFTSTAPIKSDGTDYDPSVDAPIIYERWSFWNPGKEFYNLPPGEPESSPSTKGNVIPGYSHGGTKGTEENLGAATAALGESGAGFLANLWNFWNPLSTQSALTEEGRLHRGFSSAANAVDSRLTNGILKTDLGNITINPQQRADLINFVADGSLNHDNTPESIKSALQTAWYGVQLITKDRNQTIREETRQAISDITQKYKKAGGGNEFDKISQFYEHE